MTRRPMLVALAALTLLVATCSSKAADDTGSNGNAGGDSSTGGAAEGTPLPGTTDDTINISFIGADFAALAEAGLAPDLGDMNATVPAMIEWINEQGGIAGRQIDATVDIVDGTGGTDVLRAACVKATEEDDAAVVILSPAIGRTIARCTSVQERTITIGDSGWDDPLYDEAQGRLFSVGSPTSIGTYRNAQAWAQVLDDQGVLDGKTVGVVTSEDFAEVADAAQNALVPELEDLGYEVAQVAVLPCPENDTDCEQQEATMQTFKDAGVDLVFDDAGPLAGPAVLSAAEAIDYHPQWVACCNTMTDTVAQFYADVADEFDGTLGISTLFSDRGPEATECLDETLQRSGEDYDPASDAAGFTMVNCLAFRILQSAGDTIDGDLTVEGLVAAIEGLGEVPSTSTTPGTLGPDKHDAGDSVFLAEYHADTGTFEATDDETPIEVPA